MQGYTVPLDKRLAADGRGLQEVQINDQFAKLTEALYVAEGKAREAVDMRQKARATPTTCAIRPDPSGPRLVYGSAAGSQRSAVAYDMLG